MTQPTTTFGDRAAQWLSRLIQIPSVTPVQAGPRAGEPGEARIAEQVALWFRDLGGEVFVEPVLPDRPNVYAIWRGQTGRWCAVDVHVDTVGVEQMIGDPFSGRIEDGKVWGRGAVDNKASLAVILTLLEMLHARGQRPGPNLLIGATVDEEYGATGAPAFARWMRLHQLPDQMIVAEPTMCVPVCGHRGICRFELHVHGRAVHSSQPEAGENAIVAAARMILALDQEHARLQSGPPLGHLGRPVLTVTLVEGGSGINIVPDLCKVSVDRRVVDGENPAQVCNDLYQLAQSASPLPVTMHVQHQINAFFQSPTTPWVQQLSEWTNCKPEFASFGTNACAFHDLPGDCIVLGPGSIDQAHGAEEWIAIEQLEKLGQIYARWWEIAL